MSAPVWLPQGTVYGPLLNFRREWDLWAPKMAEPPYKAAPEAPVLYIKTANTFAPNGAAIAVPGEVEIGATLGLVIGDAEKKSPPALVGSERAAMKNGVDEIDRIASCVLLNDLSLPHASYYRPPLKFRNRDGFLVCGAALHPLPDLGALALAVHVNGRLVQRVSLSALVRDAVTLLRNVGAFMTLQTGDVLMLGTDCLDDGTRPRAKAGDRIDISAPGLATLVHTLVSEAATPSRPEQGADTSARSGAPS